MKIWNTNDVLIILKGDQRWAIQEMLNCRSFALLKITVNENTDYHSSVYRHTYMRYCAIRNRGSETLFYQCEYCLFMDSGWKDEDKNIQPTIKRICESNDSYELLIESPAIDDLLVFLEDKELLFNEYYIDAAGSIEEIYRDFFLDHDLRIWPERKSAVYDELYDVRVFVTRICDSDDRSPERLASADIRKFDLNQRVLDRVYKTHGIYSYKNTDDFLAVFETQSKSAQATNLLKVVYSGIENKKDPVAFLCYRFSVFELPNSVSVTKTKLLNANKRACDLPGGAEYIIDSIHVNSDICVDLDEFEQWLKDDFDSMSQQ